MFLNLGPGELVAIFVVGFILFGPDGVADVAKTVGKAIKTVQRVSQEANRSVQQLLDIDDDVEFLPTYKPRTSFPKSRTAKRKPTPDPLPNAAAMNDLFAADKIRTGPAKNVILIGGPASGKGTQCRKLVQEYGFVHVSAGDLLRDAAASDSDLGLRAKSYMDMGWLVPDEITIELVCERLGQDDCLEQGWLLDGYPRSMIQARALRDAGFVPDVVVLLEAPEEVLVQRVTGRRLDPETGDIYHVEFNPPPDDEAIQARLITRADDDEEKVKTRLAVHEKSVEAIVAFYEGSGLLQRVDGNRSQDRVFEVVSTALGFEPITAQEPLEPETTTTITTATASAGAQDGFNLNDVRVVENENGTNSGTAAAPVVFPGMEDPVADRVMSEDSSARSDGGSSGEQKQDARTVKA